LFCTSRKQLKKKKTLFQAKLKKGNSNIDRVFFFGKTILSPPS